MGWILAFILLTSSRLRHCPLMWSRSARIHDPSLRRKIYAESSARKLKQLTIFELFILLFLSLFFTRPAAIRSRCGGACRCRAWLALLDTTLNEPRPRATARKGASAVVAFTTPASSVPGSCSIYGSTTHPLCLAPVRSTRSRPRGSCGTSGATHGRTRLFRLFGACGIRVAGQGMLVLSHPEQATKGVCFLRRFTLDPSPSSFFSTYTRSGPHTPCTPHPPA